MMKRRQNNFFVLCKEIVPKKLDETPHNLLMSCPMYLLLIVSSIIYILSYSRLKK